MLKLLRRDIRDLSKEKAGLIDEVSEKEREIREEEERQKDKVENLHTTKQAVLTQQLDEKHTQDSKYKSEQTEENKKTQLTKQIEEYERLLHQQENERRE